MVSAKLFLLRIELKGNKHKFWRQSSRFKYWLLLRIGSGCGQEIYHLLTVRSYGQEEHYTSILCKIEIRMVLCSEGSGKV